VIIADWLNIIVVLFNPPAYHHVNFDDQYVNFGKQHINFVNQHVNFVNHDVCFLNQDILLVNYKFLVELEFALIRLNVHLFLHDFTCSLLVFWQNQSLIIFRFNHFPQFLNLC
jgi:hypothetical protein